MAIYPRAVLNTKLAIYMAAGSNAKMAIYPRAVLNTKLDIYMAAGSNAKMAIYPAAVLMPKRLYIWLPGPMRK